MALNILSIAVLVALAAGFGWLAYRAWHSHRAAVRWGGGILAGLLTLVLVAITAVALLGFYRIYGKNGNPVSNVKVTAAPDQLARGQRLAGMCIGCHSSTGDLPLDGSKDDFAAGGPPVGSFYVPNLTPAGPLKDWSDGEIVRAIREGVHQNGRALLIMPSPGFRGMSDADVQALVAYLRSQPAVQRDLPPVQPNVLAALFVGTGMFSTSATPPISGPVNAPPQGVTPAYGEYLVSIAGCRDCHGKNLEGTSGGGPTSPPAAPNLRDTAGKWQAPEFVQTIRTGTTPTGQKLSEEMPWKDIGRAFTDDELKAIHAYLVALGPVATQQ